MVGLYFVQFLGEPAKEHPLFWDAGKTCLAVCLFASSPEQAEQRAREFGALACLENLNLKQLLLAPTPVDYGRLQVWARDIEQTGFAFSVLHLPAGT